MSVQPKSGKGGDCTAFPGTWMDVDSMGNVVPREFYPGMSFRAWAAVMALQDILSDSTPGQHKLPEQASRDAVAYADAIINALEVKGA